MAFNFYANINLGGGGPRYYHPYYHPPAFEPVNVTYYTQSPPAYANGYGEAPPMHSAPPPARDPAATPQALNNFKAAAVAYSDIAQAPEGPARVAAINHYFDTLDPLRAADGSITVPAAMHLQIEHPQMQIELPKGSRDITQDFAVTLGTDPAVTKEMDQIALERAKAKAAAAAAPTPPGPTSPPSQTTAPVQGQPGSDAKPEGTPPGASEPATGGSHHVHGGGHKHHHGGHEAHIDTPNAKMPADQVEAVQKMLVAAGYGHGMATRTHADGIDGLWQGKTEGAFEKACHEAGIDPKTVDFTKGANDPLVKQFTDHLAAHAPSIQGPKHPHTPLQPVSETTGPDTAPTKPTPVAADPTSPPQGVVEGLVNRFAGASPAVLQQVRDQAGTPPVAHPGRSITNDNTVDAKPDVSKLTPDAQLAFYTTRQLDGKNYPWMSAETSLQGIKSALAAGANPNLVVTELKPDEVNPAQVVMVKGTAWQMAQEKVGGIALDPLFLAAKADPKLTVSTPGEADQVLPHSPLQQTQISIGVLQKRLNNPHALDDKATTTSKIAAYEGLVKQMDPAPSAPAPAAEQTTPPQLGAPKPSELVKNVVTTMPFGGGADASTPPNAMTQSLQAARAQGVTKDLAPQDAPATHGGLTNLVYNAIAPQTGGIQHSS